MISSFEVLVVSSDPTLRRRLADILVTLGIDPVRLSSLRECREILDQKLVGLVFCDARVADGNYQDLLASYARSASRPRVVVTSSTADWDEFKQAMQCGAFDVIPVPCRHTDVEWMVIQAKRAERQVEASRPPRVEGVELAKAASAS
jgi:DNA-binding NtrC family response regulator